VAEAAFAPKQERLWGVIRQLSAAAGAEQAAEL
jgi:hypothetical protein